MKKKCNKSYCLTPFNQVCPPCEAAEVAAKIQAKAERGEWREHLAERFMTAMLSNAGFVKKRVISDDDFAGLSDAAYAAADIFMERTETQRAL